MRGSQLDRRITLQVSIPVDDGSGYGTTTPGWVTFGTPRMPAQIQDGLPSKSESASNGIRIGTFGARIRIRYLAGVTSDMRLLVHGQNDRLMRIVGGPAEIGRREWLEFMVEEYSTQGEGA